MLHPYGNKFKSISSKKRNKTKSKKKLAHTTNTLNSSEHTLQLEYSHLNTSNISRKTDDEYNNLFDESVLISSSHFPPPKNKYSEYSKSNNQIFNSPNRHCKLKKKKIICSKEKNSNWYQKVMNIFCDEESLEKPKNQSVLTTEEHINMCSFEPVLTYSTIQLNPSEQQKQSLPLSDLNNISFQSLQHSNKSSSRNDNHSVLSSVRSKSNIDNSIITIEESHPSQPSILYDKHLPTCTNSSYESCYQLDKSKSIEDCRLQNVDYISVNSSNDEDFAIKTNNEDYNLLQLNQCKTPSSCKNSTCTIQNNLETEDFSNSCYSRQDYSKVSSADHLDFKLLNILDRIDNNKQSTYAENNQSSVIPLDENTRLQSDNEQFDSYPPDSESQILLDVTTKFSDIIIDDTTEQRDESIKEESVFSEFYRTYTSNLQQDIILNNSSILQSSSSLEQDTVIYKQKGTDVLHTKENADCNNLLLNDKSIELKSHVTTNRCKENINAENQINILNSVSNDILEINESNLSVFMPRRKRYAARFQNLDAIDESSQLETNFTEENSKVFHLEPGKKWRRSISIVRSFMDRNMNESINFTKGRKWANTVDDILRRQSISNV